MGRLVNVDKVDKPVILEHHGVKEIMSLDDIQGYINSGQEVCDKCVHFNCVCELHD